MHGGAAPAVVDGQAQALFRYWHDGDGLEPGSVEGADHGEQIGRRFVDVAAGGSGGSAGHPP